MERNTSIITMVGATQYNTTAYKFTDDSLSNKTTIFSNALIEHYREELKTVVFLGTETSTWSAILPECKNDEDQKFLDKLKSIEAIKPKRPSISKEDFESLKKRLKEFYTDFDVHVLPPQKSNINLEENPLDVYSRIIKYVEDTKIVFDITSAFRYMPLFIFESLQTYSPKFDVNNFTLLYAEKSEDEDEYYQVRDISEVWRAAEINKTLYTFRTTLDGKKLAEHLDRAGERLLAEWIMYFSDCIQKSYMALCNYEFFKKLKDIIDATDIESVSYSFIKETINFLKSKILPKFEYIDNNNIPESGRRSWCMFTLAEILYEFKMHSQAFISLRESVIMRLIENGNPKLLNQDQISPEDIKPLENAVRKKFEKYHVDEKWRELKNTRNHGAHAGIELINYEENMEAPDDFAKYRDTVCKILTKVVPCKDVSGS